MSDRKISLEIKKMEAMTMRYVLSNLKNKNSSVSNPIQCEILVMLSENDGSAVQKDIETALSLRKSTVSGIIDTMIRYTS